MQTICVLLSASHLVPDPEIDSSHGTETQLLWWFSVDCSSVRRSRCFAERRNSVSRSPRRVLEVFPVPSLTDICRTAPYLRRRRRTRTSKLKSYRPWPRTLQPIRSRGK